MTRYVEVGRLITELLGVTSVNVHALKAIMLLCGEQENFVKLLCRDMDQRDFQDKGTELRPDHVSSYLDWLSGVEGVKDFSYWEDYVFSIVGDDAPWGICLPSLEDRDILLALLDYRREKSGFQTKQSFEIADETISAIAPAVAARLGIGTETDPSEWLFARLDVLVEAGLLFKRGGGLMRKYSFRLQVLPYLQQRLLARQEVDR